MPKPVYDEINRPTLQWMKRRVDALTASGDITIQELLAGSEEFNLYYQFTTAPEKGFTLIQNGEAAAIALAKSSGGILASNNLRDVKQYVSRYGLAHTTTADLLVDAYRGGLITQAQGDGIWADMLKHGRRIGDTSFSNYLAKHPAP